MKNYKDTYEAGDLKSAFGVAYKRCNGEVMVIWPDGYLHVFESEKDWNDVNVEPIEIIAPMVQQ